ncbi:MAG: M3 family metallopeptidase [Notoacmeibacter sp.]|nr:M3 family metallopeptidase [Notoacmeibacter sp.]
MAMIDLKTHPLTAWSGPLGLPDFRKVRVDDFLPVFEAAFAAHEAEVAAMADNPDAPTIANTLEALELAGDALSRVSSVFWCLAGADTNPALQALEREISPKMSRHFSAISMNDRLFARIDALYSDRAGLGLDAETDRVLELTWKYFVRSGARLADDGKARLAAINECLAGLGASFGQNVLADEAQWALVLDEADLEGLPDFLRKAMSAAATAHGQDGRFAVTLSRSIYEPFMTLSPRRDLREQAWRAFIARGGNGGATDNGEIVRETLALRAEKAALLGYDSFAALKLDGSMAKTPAAVMALLEPVWDAARSKAAEDEAELKHLAAATGQNHAIEGWDWRFYADKLRAEKFAFDETQLKPFLQLDNIIAACFDVAGRLFGLSFVERPDVEAWHADARSFEIRNGDGTLRGTFIADYFNRASKRSGAWMSALQSAHKLAGGEMPVIYNVMNFAKPPAGEAALLSMDEARTLFHEFGHALHGMLTEVRWPSVSGTAVSRDFVELPSQLYEHWLTVPEILRKHARHFKTGEPMPLELMERLLAAQSFDQGFATVEFTASALMDMAFHEGRHAPEDPIRFETETMERLQKPDAIAMRHRTPHFQHVFAGDGYSAGYYSYLWSEVLDADAFEAFKEAGDPFDPELAAKLKKHIYSAGGSQDPEELYTAFRGKMPSAEAMMRGRGLGVLSEGEM